jgi:hypothetical protein
VPSLAPVHARVKHFGSHWRCCLEEMERRERLQSTIKETHDIISNIISRQSSYFFEGAPAWRSRR